MIRFKDFVPEIISAGGFLKMAEYETFDAAVEAANLWLQENPVKLIQLETVVLPNIWSKFEEGSTDASLGTRADYPSHWHQFLRCWYDDGHPARRAPSDSETVVD